MAIDWELHTDDDLKLTAGDFTFVDEALRVAQAVQVALRTFRGEWFLNVNTGVPYFQSILGKKVLTTTAEFDSVIKAAVLDVADVNRILAYSSSYNQTTRVYSVAFTADTTFGPIDYSGVLP